MKQSIPLHRLNEKITTLFQVEYVQETTTANFPDFDRIPHRDDHYIFFLVEKGDCSIVVDFETIRLERNTLFYIQPSQVHHRIDKINGQGWYVVVDIACIPKNCWKFLETDYKGQIPMHISNKEFKSLRNLLSILHENQNENGEISYYKPMLLAGLHTFIYYFSCIYEKRLAMQIVPSRFENIIQNFVALIKQNTGIRKSPSAYASELNISEGYLNEVLKKSTGYSVSQYIHNEMAREAKQLLCHTNLTIKEIANSIGYEDYSYFSRLFNKITGMSATKFRNNYRK